MRRANARPRPTPRDRYMYPLLGPGAVSEEASPQETSRKKPNPETPGHPLMFGVGTSRFP
eukprot:9501649-Pyramimonas_sp.AAC.1